MNIIEAAKKMNEGYRVHSDKYDVTIRNGVFGEIVDDEYRAISLETEHLLATDWTAVVK